MKYTISYNDLKLCVNANKKKLDNPILSRELNGNLFLINYNPEARSKYHIHAKLMTGLTLEFYIKSQKEAAKHFNNTITQF